MDSRRGTAGNVMPTYRAPVDETLFVLNDVLHVERYNNLPGFAETTPDLAAAVLGEAAKLCEDVLTQLNRVGDKEGCKRLADGSVITPPGFKDAYDKLVAGGWVGASAPVEFGGQGLPMFLTVAVREFMYSSNIASRCIRASRSARSRRSTIMVRRNRKPVTCRS